jgi:DNA-directed RNA polymerase subunit M/transcription elongation factor TFIIS
MSNRKTGFDLDKHTIKMVIIQCGKLLYPDEKNITTLYETTSRALGLALIETTTASANHLPTPAESAKANPENLLNQVCPKCQKNSFILHGLCPTCKDSEDGKYKTMWKCYDCGHQEKSEEPMVIWLQKLGIDFRIQSKQSLGIQTVTDEGIR